MAIWLLLLPIIAKPQEANWDLAQKVTYTTVAKSAKNVCAELTQLSNIPLEASASVATEVLVIDVKDVSLKQLMDKVAFVCSAKWEKGKEYIRLDRPSEIEFQERQADVAITAKAIRREIDKITAKVEKLKPFDEQGVKDYITQQADLDQRVQTSVGKDSEVATKESMAHEHTGLSGRLSDRLIAGIDPIQVAKMRIYERVVYSTQPNPLQKAFLNPAKSAFALFLQDWRAWQDCFLGTEIPRDRMSDDVEKLFGSNHRPVKAILSCAWLFNTDILRIELSVASDRNDRLCSETTYLRLEASAPQRKPVPDGKTLTFSELAREWSKNFESLRHKQDPIYASDKFREWAKQPERFDPLSLQPSEVVLALAKEKSKNLVANLTDRSILIGELARIPSDKTIDQYRDFLIDYCQMDLKDDDGWLIAQPSNPFRSRIERLNRSALGRLMTIYHRDGFARLETLADFVQANSPEALEASSLTANSMIWIDSHGSLNEPEFLRFYATLSPQQRQDLMNSKKLSISSLSVPQRALISGMCYANSTTHNEISVAERIGSPFESIFREPTEAFPQGIPLGGSVSFPDTIGEEIAVDIRSLLYTATPAIDLARNLFFVEHPEMSPDPVSWRDGGYVLGKRHSCEYDICLLPEFVICGSLGYVAIDRTQTPTTVTHLSEDFSALLDQYLKSYRNRLKD
jgi:hypothetical protein